MPKKKKTPKIELSEIHKDEDIQAWSLDVDGKPVYLYVGLSQATSKKTGLGVAIPLLTGKGEKEKKTDWVWQKIGIVGNLPGGEVFDTEQYDKEVSRASGSVVPKSAPNIPLAAKSEYNLGNTVSVRTSASGTDAFVQFPDKGIDFILSEQKRKRCPNCYFEWIEPPYRERCPVCGKHV